MEEVEGHLVPLGEGEEVHHSLVEEGVGQEGEVPPHEELVPWKQGVVVVVSLHVREGVVGAHHGTEGVVVGHFLSLLEVVVGLPVREEGVVGALLIVLSTVLVEVVLKLFLFLFLFHV